MTDIYKAIVYTFLYGTALAMGIASVVLSALKIGSFSTIGIILGIAMLCVIFVSIANIRPSDYQKPSQ